MVFKAENFHKSLPYRFTANDFMDWFGPDPRCTAIMQMLNRQLQPFEVFFIRHSVQIIPQRSLAIFDASRFRRRHPYCPMNLAKAMLLEVAMPLQH